jgi:hypothetical protein
LSFVVDASVAIKWFVDEPDSAQAAVLLRHSLAAPDLLAPECANILWKKVTRAELSLEEAEVIALALEGRRSRFIRPAPISRARCGSPAISGARRTSVSIWLSQRGCGSHSSLPTCGWSTPSAPADLPSSSCH